MVIFSSKYITRKISERNLIDYFKAFRNFSLISHYRKKDF